MNLNQGIEAELDIQRVVILHQHCKSSIAGIVLGAIIIGAVGYANLPLQIFLGWFLLALSAAPLRAVLRKQLSRAIDAQDLSVDHVLKWEKYWTISALLPALVILSAISLPYNGDKLVIFLFIALVTVAMISGSILSSATSLKTFLVFINATVPPFVLVCLIKGSGYFVALGAFLIVFYFVFLLLGLAINKSVLNAIRLQIQQKDMSYKDSLTGLWNRRKLYNVVETLKGAQFSVLLIDVDRFKQLNDRYGHSRGDEELIRISESITLNLGENDLAIRYGGEEFLVLLKDQDVEKAEILAEKMRVSVIQNCKLTVSIGIATTEQSEDFDSVVDLADRAMYDAKRRGRNLVHKSDF